MKGLEVQWVCSDGEAGEFQEREQKEDIGEATINVNILKKSTDITIETLNCLLS